MTRAITAAVVALLVVVLAPLAAGKAKPKPPLKLVGNYALGTEVFNTTCATCHNGPGGIGPELTNLKLTEAQIITEIDNGGGAFMGQAAAKYAIQMQGYKDALTPAQINNLAAYVWLQVHDCPPYDYLVARGGYTYTRC